MVFDTLRAVAGFVFALTGLMISTASPAAVSDVGANGFEIAITAHIAATPEAVYVALTAPRLWWNPAHTYSHDAANLSLDPHAGGCFCETLTDGGSVQHATVAFVMPNRTLRLRGPLGPFQSQGIASALTITLKPVNGGTDLSLTDSFGGYMKGGFANWPKAADAMLSDLVARLKAYAETGGPTPTQ